MLSYKSFVSLSPAKLIRFFSVSDFNWKSSDMYERLGVKRDASSDEIKKNYHELVKKYHPDRLKTDKEKEEGQEIISAVNEAYDILKDEKKRADYDTFGSSGQEMLRPHTVIYKSASVVLDFLDSLFGVKKEIDIFLDEGCPTCHETGMTKFSSKAVCPSCQGSGILPGLMLPIPCYTCMGRGFVIQNPCANCSGSGKVLKPVKYPVDIPPGVKDGDIFNFNSPYGPVRCVCKVNGDPIFQQDSNGFHITVPISIKTAVCGGIVKIPTLKGIVEKKIRPGIQPNEVESINFGNSVLHLHYKVIIPREINSNEKEKYNNLGDGYMLNTNSMYHNAISQFEDRLRKYTKN